MNTMTTKLASLLSTLAAAASLSLFGAGCVVDASADPGVVVTDPTPAIADVTIDTGAAMAASPGEGVGIYVEYAGDGHWNVFTTCDTSISGASCNFDLVVSSDESTSIGAVEGSDLGPTDSLTLQSDGSIRLVADTDYGMNGFSFDADPGATIELDALLDGEAQPEFIYAISDGALLKGMPSNPVDFTPATL
jgi:hypothetical protein